ncbi:hypothetical protein EJ05DRAFT_490332 [Pseudovirgaria hyperparasitica]|uniref:Extracellular membrane protein CFEM domain-containing protein n=1 Tax=Pseudovirgaria hyperparasitica TaxID=470096 RepID=A0A6A6VV34_9PEZI|nr:uncharacterized protein EJ05DRAFT_490332 [Pseudovirgaria hyperparasitica]KAF2753111.1 hypothetical protein EJ05DRAFT_490332 [Pseudovirgaria hyperparasitica]
MRFSAVCTVLLTAITHAAPTTQGSPDDQFWPLTADLRNDCARECIFDRRPLYFDARNITRGEYCLDPAHVIAPFYNCAYPCVMRNCGYIKWDVDYPREALKQTAEWWHRVCDGIAPCWEAACDGFDPKKDIPDDETCAQMRADD